MRLLWVWGMVRGPTICEEQQLLLGLAIVLRHARCAQQGGELPATALKPLEEGRSVAARPPMQLVQLEQLVQLPPPPPVPHTLFFAT